MSKFVASNGGFVEGAPVGGFRVFDGTNDGGFPNSVYVSEAAVDVLREFFLDERDTELGRWRWPENPDLVVYRKPDEDDRHGRAVFVFEESSGAGFWCWDERPSSVLNEFEQAARAFFEAHPEPRPWQAAKPGEVWVVTFYGDEHLVHVIETWDEDVVFQFGDSAGDPSRVLPDHSGITAGRRIWPEDKEEV